MPATATGLLAAIPVAVAGILVISALAIIWRSFCEFYVVIIGIGEDLRVMRRSAELGQPAPEAIASVTTPSASRRRAAADRDQ